MIRSKPRNPLENIYHFLSVPRFINMVDFSNAYFNDPSNYRQNLFDYNYMLFIMILADLLGQTFGGIGVVVGAGGGVGAGAGVVAESGINSHRLMSAPSTCLPSINAQILLGKMIICPIKL